MWFSKKKWEVYTVSDCICLRNSSTLCLDYPVRACAKKLSCWQSSLGQSIPRNKCMFIMYALLWMHQYIDMTCTYVQECLCKQSLQHTYLITSYQAAARATPLQQCDAGCMCAGKDCLISGGVCQQHYLSILPAECQHWLCGVPTQHCGLVRTF